MNTKSDESDAYVGMGSNLQEPRAQLEQAVTAMKRLPHSRLVAISFLYDSAPIGPPDQPRYLNAAVKLVTQLPPVELLLHLQDIERAQQRRRTAERWGPRTLDLDLLLYGAQRIDDDVLTVPHPRLAERAFALYPLRDLDPDLTIPGRGKLLALMPSVADQSLSMIGPLHAH